MVWLYNHKQFFTFLVLSGCKIPSMYGSGLRWLKWVVYTLFLLNLLFPNDMYQFYVGMSCHLCGFGSCWSVVWHQRLLLSPLTSNPTTNDDRLLLCCYPVLEERWDLEIVFTKFPFPLHDCDLIGCTRVGLSTAFTHTGRATVDWWKKLFWGEKLDLYVCEKERP